MPEDVDIAEAGAEEVEDRSGARWGGRIVAVLVGLTALGAGAAAGAGLVAPRLAPVLAERAEAARLEEAVGGDASGAGEASTLHVIDNLVVNPARSNGTRFLLASVGVQARSPADVGRIAARDVELRDALLLVLGSKTVEELTDVSTRATLATELRAAVEAVIGGGVVSRIYLPQFVIQ